MQLVMAKVGLTNFYPDQVIRNNQINLDSMTVDELVSQNLNGGVMGSTLLNAAALCGGLSAQASGFAGIAGGWNDSKGLMLLRFVNDGDNPVMVEYTNVIGYIHGNDADGLSANAIFVPQFSWQTTERVVGGISLGSPTDVKRTIANRTDYLMNDGYQTGNITLRPSDIMDYAANHSMQNEILQRMEEEGLEGQHPTTVVAGTDISRVGVIPSRRSNLNPSAYAGEILNASIGYQQRIRGHNGGEHGSEQGYNDGIYGELSTASQQLSCLEPRLLRDEFFRVMAETMGVITHRNFSGFTIGDLNIAFPEFAGTLDLTMYDAENYQLANYTETSASMGTSQIGEFVAQEITMNIMDLMIRHDLSSIKFRGSNCEYGGDGSLGNIVIIPFEGFSLKDDDYDLGNKMEQFVFALKTQIFQKLNGANANSLTPIRFEVSAELFGTCNIWITLVDQSNLNDQFQMNDGGDVIGMVCRSFPTFAINNFSSMLGTNDFALQAGANQMSNIQNYFS